MPGEPTQIRITDSCLRDGSHAVAHQLSTEQVRSVVAALDRAGVPVLEVAHGDGLGGSSFTYGFSRTPERELIAAAVATARRARIAALLLPGIGTARDIYAVAELGVSIIEGAITHVVASVVDAHPAGDHTLFIGAVLDFEHRGGEPLIFHSGTYRRLITSPLDPTRTEEWAGDLHAWRLGGEV